MKPTQLYSCVLLLACLFAAQLSFAQEEDIVLKAMRDELERSMNELNLPDHKKPFFIQYGVRSMEVQSIIASMGALYRSGIDKSRDKSVRVLVGSYEFNDESLDDDITSEPEANEIELPLEDDYYGIRRAFWATTDNVYRNAAKHFTRNEATLKDQKKPLEEIPHRHFAKATAVELIKPHRKIEVDTELWENFCRKLSEKFNSNTAINYSGVILTLSQGDNYIVNSEGTNIRTPFSVVTLMISAQGRSDEGENIMEQIIHQATDPKRLPPMDSIESQVDQMLEKMKSEASIPTWKDSYVGPVLYLGPSSAELLAGHLLYGRESLRDNNSIPSLRGYQVETNGMEAKIGKQLFSEAMTVKATPKVTAFQGVELLGSFEVDDEGIVPPDEFVLIEDGILKNLLNDRTLTSPQQKATGHASGPGVIDISFNNGITQEQLKKQLLSKARSEGLDYAIIVRSKGFGRMGPSQVYKADVNTGEEQLYRGASIEGFSSRTIRKIAATSSERIATNFQAGMGGETLSIIAPSGILFDELDVNEAQIPSFKDEQFVESPLEKEQG